MSIFDDGISRWADQQPVQGANFRYLDRGVASIMERLFFPMVPIEAGSRVMLSEKGREVYRLAPRLRLGTVTDRKCRSPAFVSVLWDGLATEQSISLNFLQHGWQR